MQTRRTHRDLRDGSFWKSSQANRKEHLFPPLRRLALEALEERWVLSMVPFPVPAGSSAGFEDVGGLEAKGVLVVSTAVDEDDGDFSPGDLSLREALALAADQGGDDVIQFDGGLVGSTITLDPRLGQLTITSNVAIEGPGPEQLTIDADGNCRVFKVNAGTTVSISGLSVTGGGGVEMGAGIFSYSRLVIANTTVSGNTAFAKGPSSPPARAIGGGILNWGRLTIIGSTISGNSADVFSPSGSAQVQGGGVHSNGELTITNSTITGNSALADAPSGHADAHGGGIYVRRDATITNSTITGNSTLAVAWSGHADAQGGGVHNNGELTITNSTVTGNSALADAPYGRPDAHGGGIHVSEARPITLHNAIVAGNDAHDDGKDVFGSFDAAGSFNLIGIIDGSTQLDGTGTLYGTVESPLDPSLGPLDDNGGPAPTHALLRGSPAIDAGSDDRAVDAGLIQDQRGFDRFVDGDRDAAAVVDIGAYEYGTRESLVVSTADDESDGDFSLGDLSLREALATAGELPGANPITFDGRLAGASITLDPALGPLVLDSDVDVQGLGADRLTVDAGGGGRVFSVSDAVSAAIRGLTVTGGSAGGNGGGIHNAGTLEISHAMVSGNSAGVDGGGISNAGTLTIRATTLSDNSAAGSGGGICNDGELMTILNATIWGNSAEGPHGGGIANNSGTLAMVGATIRGNSAETSGGGIAHRAGTTSMHNTITAENTLADGTTDDVAGNFSSASSHNLVGVIDGSVGLDGTGTLFGTAGSPLDPMLGPLADYGGPTPTAALLSGSPALEVGSNARANDAGVTHDQRGFGRFFDTDGDGAATVDIGALESHIDELTPAARLISAPDVVRFGDTVQMSLMEYTDNVGMDVSTFDGMDLHVSGPRGYAEYATPTSIDGPPDGMRRTVTYRIPAAGAAWDESDNGTYEISLQGGQVADTSGNFAPAGPLGTFAVTLGDEEPNPQALQAVEPLGSLIYETSVSAGIGVSGESDSYAIDLGDDQTITVVVDPDAMLQPIVELFDRGGMSLRGVTAGAAGEDALMQLVPTNGAGTYTVDLRGAASSTGGYTIWLLLGATVEEESHDGPTNDDPASAQDLNGSIVTVGAGPAQRGAVLGSLASGSDWYRLTLDDGQSATLAAAARTPGDLTLQLYNSNLELLAMGVPAENVHRTISNFCDTSTDGNPDRYFARVTGDSGADYMLLVTRNVDLDTEPNNGLGADAQDITAAAGALSYLGYVTGGPLHQQSVLDPAPELDPHTHFGYSVDVDNDVAIVGAYAADRAYVFRFDGDAWNLEQELAAPDQMGRDDFGKSVAIDGNRALVGATLHDSPLRWSGAVYVFQYDGGQWGLRQKLAASDATTGSPPTIHFGASVSVSGDRLIVGSDGFLDVGVLSCGAYVFEFDGDQWVEQQKLTIPEGIIQIAYDCADAAIDGDTAAISVRTSRDDSHDQFHVVFVFGYDGTQWVPQQRLLPADVIDSDRFGRSLALSDNTIIVGAENHDAADRDAGAAYVFDYDGARWVQTQKLLADDGGRDDHFGISVSISGDLAVIGAEEHDGQASNAGAAYLFEFNGTGWLQRAKLTASPATESDEFGYCVAIEGGKVIVGTDGPIENTGTAHLFDFDVAQDSYAFEARIGDRLVISTTTPNHGASQPINACDPILQLYDPSGVAVAVDDNGAPDGHNARLTHAAAATGTYTVTARTVGSTAGECLVTIAGHTGELPTFEVAATDPRHGAVLSAAPRRIVVELNDSLLLTTLDASDLMVDGVPATGFTIVDHATVAFDLPELYPGYHQVVIVAGAFRDLQNTPVEAIVLGITAGVFPTPLQAVDPLGSSVYQSSLSEKIAAADHRQLYSVVLAASQRITLAVDPDSTLQPEVQLTDPKGVVIGSTAASTPGESAVLQMVTTTVAGEYLISAGGVAATAGAYDLRLIANAAVEDALPANDGPASAQDLDAYFLPLAGGMAEYGAVLGTLPPRSNPVRYEDFESGSLDGPWTTYSSMPGGRIQVTGRHGTAAGLYALLMDQRDDDLRWTLNEAIWNVDLSGLTEATLSFYHAKWDDERDPFNGSFAGHYDADGIAVSDDGVDWYPAWDVSQQRNGQWVPYQVDLAAAATSAGIALGPDFRIKFQQYDNGSLEGDGRGYDEIMITVPVPPAAKDAVPPAAKDAVPLEGDWYRFSLPDGQSATLAVTAQTPADVTLELYDDSQTLLATGIAAENLDGVIHHFVAEPGAEPRTCYVRVSGVGDEYSLIVTRDADFDHERNSTPQNAQQLSPADVALGYLSYPVPSSAKTGGSARPDVTVGTAESAGAEFVPGRLIVRMVDTKTSAEAKALKASLLASHGGKIAHELSLIDAMVVELPDGKADVPQAVAEWSADPAVLYAEPDYVYHALAPVPNDPMFDRLWGLHNTGQTGGIIDADIDAPEAWDISTGSPDVVVAVIDTGVEYTHEDLTANMWVNPGETAGDGIDNDGNGYVDDVYGIDAVNGDSDPMDDHDHGTHVSGIIAGVGDNGIGVTGVARNARVMAVKFLSASGGGSTSNAVICLDYLTMMKTDYGVNLVAANASWGGGGLSQALRDAIQAANDAGIMFVASAGNDGTDNDSAPHYPSSYDLDGIIAVAASYPDDNMTSFSCYGATSVDLAAPGSAILSTVTGNSYQKYNGTSMAAPHVTGAVAVMAAHDPDATLAEIKAAILNGADPAPDFQGTTVSGGRLNLANALTGRMGDRGDYYQIEVAAADTLAIATATPGDGPGEFDNPVDPSLELFDPDGQLVADDDNSAPDGRNARLVYEAGIGGTYTVRVLSIAGCGEYVLTVIPTGPTVVGRHVFYNNSIFDGYDPAANSQDDDAIAPDKVALLPGQTATFANYTGYSRGLGGIMVDVAALPGTPAAEDFQFRAGNDDHPGGWPLAPAPSSIAVRPGDGINGSDRVTIVWPDNAIDKQWLQVTVLPTANTGLEEADAFYFGNAIGECGDSTTDAQVNSVDMLAARDNQRSLLDRAPIDFFVDFNRDQKVNATDMLIARNNTTHFLNALRLITVPAAKVANATWGPEDVAFGKLAFGKLAFGKLDWLNEFEPTRTAIPPPGRPTEAGRPLFLRTVLP